MTVFASKTPRDLIAHPADPDICGACWGILPPEGVTMVPDDGQVCDCPMPTQNNEPNGILTAFRAIDAGRNEYAAWVRDFDENPGFWTRGYGDPNARYPQYTPLELDHARRVLTRLARLAEGAYA
ncbi:hypothetical protein MRBLMI12_000465 [Microbacterium sp. LMI12-1-1.1]|uniref:hypothetical protein n=1 Tax=Microbacterium sp. LMI12-1-1.1 TaxID=3135225 RepID=UPI00343D5D75